jgi:hypothetical protein
MIFMDRHMISFGVREIDKEVLTLLKLPPSNTVGVLLDM